MIQPLHKDWHGFIESFNANKVEYLVVGAFAVAHHGRRHLIMNKMSTGRAKDLGDVEELPPV